MLGVIGNSFQEESNSILNVISRITKELIIQNRTFENNNRLVDDKIEKMKECYQWNKSHTQQWEIIKCPI